MTLALKFYVTVVVRPVAEYWLSLAIATVADLWRPAGLHRRGWREQSTFEFASTNWDRMSRVVEAAPRPILTPVEAPKPPTFVGPTIGERARMHGAADTHEFVRQEFDRIAAKFDEPTTEIGVRAA